MKDVIRLVATVPELDPERFRRVVVYVDLSPVSLQSGMSARPDMEAGLIASRPSRLPGNAVVFTFVDRSHNFGPQLNLFAKRAQRLHHLERVEHDTDTTMVELEVDPPPHIGMISTPSSHKIDTPEILVAL